MWVWLIGAWLLGLVAVAGTAYLIGGYKSSPRIARCLWLAAGLWLVAGPVGFYGKYESKRPSFVYVIPGFWSSSPAPRWDMLVRLYGSQPVRNVELVFTDEDKSSANTRQESAMTGQTDEASATYRLAELDPTQGFWAAQFPWNPQAPAHEHYHATITSHEGKFGETLKIERINDKWLYEIKVVSLQTRRTVISCRDAGFPGWHLWPFAPGCFPNYVTEHMGR
ncbi:MAG TPA: hypothetical protein VL393_04165 [Candidatus Binataceae bacterium]|jgi:hypothetical protein|nr:hypothetical protein [Candidatus Binataceae bacterium]